MTQEFDLNPMTGGPLRRPTAESVGEHSHHVSGTENGPYAQTARGRSEATIRPSIRIGAIVALALAAGLVAWFLLRGNGSSNQPVQTTSARAASVDELVSLAASIGHPIFWLGPKSGYTYELTQTQSGKIYIRYLPQGAEVGANKPYLTVATYPFPNAFPALQTQGKAPGAQAFDVSNGGIAVLDRSYPESVHVAYPGVGYQVEVYDPTAGVALHTVSAGQLTHLGTMRTSSTTTPSAPSAPNAKAASVAELKSLSASLDHPIYWAGPKRGYTYELTQTSTGKVFIRYLPKGVQVGAPEPYLTIATYPFPGAFAATQRSAKGKGTDTIKLTGGGLAVVDLQYPKSIHLAFPNANVQVEVFDPSPARTRQVVSSGKIAPLS
jgi:hypothetical protein